MGMTLTNDIQSHLTVENIKTNMLNIFIELFDENGMALDEDAKQFIVDAAERLMSENKMDSSLAVSKYRARSEETGEKEFFVKMSEFDEVADLFRTTVAKLMLQVVSYELNEYLREREEG